MTSQHCKGNIKLAQVSTHTVAIRLPVLMKTVGDQTENCRFGCSSEKNFLFTAEVLLTQTGKKSTVPLDCTRTLRIHFNFISVFYSEKNIGFSYIVLEF